MGDGGGVVCDAGSSVGCGGVVSRVSVGMMMAGPLLCTGGSRVLREVVLDVTVVVQLFSVRDEKMLFSLEVLLLLGGRGVSGGLAGDSCNSGGVMAGATGAGVGSGMGTLTGSGREPLGAGCRDARPGRPFGFVLVGAFCRPMVSVVCGADRVSGGIGTVEGGKRESEDGDWWTVCRGRCLVSQGRQGVSRGLWCRGDGG